jgi:hypothetical protein
MSRSLFHLAVRWKAVIAGLLLLAGCSTAFSPFDTLTTGSLADQNRARESACGRLAAEIGSQMAVAKSLPAAAKAQRSQPPPSLFAVLTRLSDKPGGDVPAMEEFERTRDRITMLAAQSSALGCPPYDIASPLAEIERALVTP